MVFSSGPTTCIVRVDTVRALGFNHEVNVIESIHSFFFNLLKSILHVYCMDIYSDSGSGSLSTVINLPRPARRLRIVLSTLFATPRNSTYLLNSATASRAGGA